ncbi:Aldehyde/histidinol dehydrogenase [Xylaria sp. FL1042]|nr:Aldehyde/histidinol dehydrogenase [Xylaria sp. FL1042]
MAMYTVPMIINGKEQLTSNTYDVVNPSNNLTCHNSIAATPDDARAAVDAAAKALRKWGQSTPSTRRDILLRAAEVMDSNREELAEYMKVETGSSNEWTQFNLNNAIDLLKDVAGRISSIQGSGDGIFVTASFTAEIPALTKPGATHVHDMRDSWARL